MDDEREINEVHYTHLRPDPFSKKRSFASAILATAVFRCWHILLFFGAWSTAICLISNYLVDLGIQSTLLTVYVYTFLRHGMILTRDQAGYRFGSVTTVTSLKLPLSLRLSGFVISYRTTSSFERYNEGRRYWSQIVLASRTFARLVWFHVPGACRVPLFEAPQYFHLTPI